MSVRWRTPSEADGWKKSPATERGKNWLDWISPDGAWMAAEGYDELAREGGRPWSLFRRVDGRWRWMGTHKSLAEAKSQAAELAKGGSR